MPKRHSFSLPHFQYMMHANVHANATECRLILDIAASQDKLKACCSIRYRIEHQWSAQARLQAKKEKKKTDCVATIDAVLQYVTPAAQALMVKDQWSPDWTYWIIQDLWDLPTHTHTQSSFLRAYWISSVSWRNRHSEPRWPPASPSGPCQLQAIAGWHTHTHKHTISEYGAHHVNCGEIRATLEEFDLQMRHFFHWTGWWLFSSFPSDAS